MKIFVKIDTERELTLQTRRAITNFVNYLRWALSIEDRLQTAFSDNRFLTIKNFTTDSLDRIDMFRVTLKRFCDTCLDFFELEYSDSEE